MATTLLYPYVTLDDVKRYCGESLTVTTYDEDFKVAINKASRHIDSLTDGIYYKKTYTSEYLNGRKNYQGWQIIKCKNGGGYILTPKLLPIISITTLIENETTLTENTDFYIHADTGIIEKDSGDWSELPRTIQITCELGFDSDDTATPSADIPGDINFYAMEMAARLSGRYKKEIKNFVSGGAEHVDLYGVTKEMHKALMSKRPVIL